MGGFQNFAIRFRSSASWLAVSAPIRWPLSAGGGGSIGIGWIVGAVFALIVAAAMGQIASAIRRPAAFITGVRSWAARLGLGYGLAGTSSACFFVVSSVNYGVYLLLRDLVLVGISA